MVFKHFFMVLWHADERTDGWTDGWEGGWMGVGWGRWMGRRQIGRWRDLLEQQQFAMHEISWQSHIQPQNPYLFERKLSKYIYICVYIYIYIYEKLDMYNHYIYIITGELKLSVCVYMRIYLHMYIWKAWVLQWFSWWMP